MALPLGKRLGPHEILSLIGAGGMGEVYKGRDTRLDRMVAIKVLPPHLANNAEARERFEREARTIANLNHPHICTLHDIGQQDGIHYLVMEYPDGENIQQRLQRGPLPLEQVLQYATEIIDALDAAHRLGYTHRDIKPGNIMLTMTVGSKVLDFGLAKLKEEVNPAIPPDERPTKVSLTEDGRILGTVQYMAPEQVEGKTKEIDGRADIFSFGAVVYEMATGKRTFEGQSRASLMAAILKDDPPPMPSLQPMTPPALDHVVKKCLAKERENRWQRAKDLHDELKWLQQSSSQAVTTTPVFAHRKLRERLVWIAAAVLLVVFLAALLPAVHYFRSSSPEQSAIRFSIPAPEDTNFGGGPAWPLPAVSPDGKRVVFVAHNGLGQGQLWLRAFDSLSVQMLPGTEGVGAPFWSPDGRYIAFYAEGKLKKVDLSGGPPQTLAEVGAACCDGTWSRDGTILLSAQSRLFRLADVGGELTPVTELDASRGDIAHLTPHFLPDGRHFLYRIRSSKPENTGIYLGSLDSGGSVRLLNASTKAEYSSGHLLFVREGTLWAQPFDANRLTLTGEPFPVAEQIAYNATNGRAAFAVSESGVLVYRSIDAGGKTQLVWFDRDGKQLGTVGPPGEYLNPELSPDDKRVAVELGDSASKDIWVLEVARNLSSRFTFDAANDYYPHWSPDGSRIAFASNREGSINIYQKLSNGTGNEELLLKPGGDPRDWSADGRFLIYTVIGSDLYILPLFGERKPSPYLKTEFVEA